MTDGPQTEKDHATADGHFERVFAYRRWRELASRPASARALVAFHAAHKMTLLAHDRGAYESLGRLVADAGRRDIAESYVAYAAGFFAAMAKPATRKTHTNVLEHLAGFCSDRLDAEGRRHLSSAIHGYRRGLLPILVPLSILRFHLLREDAPDWVRNQVYLRPDPRELQLRGQA